MCNRFRVKCCEYVVCEEKKEEIQGGAELSNTTGHGCHNSMI